ncbi:ATP-binding protein [Haloferula sp. BvORR071]|uniref:sensor histidine kinase n=1 Tax=Haloferula sp. BvORR071 TaxID=1396141 RepID=UPI0005534884|nr:ATP-binding protein [Haloferula sp. BvORR071]
MKGPSIRRSLLIRCGLGVGVLLCLLSVAIYLLVEKSLYGELDDSVRQTAAILSNQVELEDYKITYEWQEGLGTNSALVEGALFQFWDETQHTTTRSPALGSHDLPQFHGARGEPSLHKIRLSDGRRARAVGLQIQPFVLPAEMEAMKERGRVVDPATLLQTLVVARDEEPVHHALERLRLILACGSLLTLGLGFLLVDRAIRASLRPIHELAMGVKDRASHQLDEPLDLPEALPAELGSLAEHFNLLLARVAAIRQRERDFIRHAAHELRTPIAGLRATTDLALSQSREARAYAAHLAACQKSAIELGELVTRLSALARIGQSSAPPAIEAVDAAKLWRECWQIFAGKAQVRKLTLADEAGTGPVMIMADRALLRIIFNNLFDNAIAYAIPPSAISIRIRRVATDVEIAVANAADMDEMDTSRLFEPLFRRESSRHDAGAHLGIGLTLSLEAALAMGGTLRAEQREGQIEFILTIPSAGHGVGVA